MAKKQSKKEKFPFQDFLKEREVKTGLCPNCHKFGDLCQCGYNYGFANSAELCKYKLTQEQNKKYKGTIKAVPLEKFESGMRFVTKNKYGMFILQTILSCTDPFKGTDGEMIIEIVTLDKFEKNHFLLSEIFTLVVSCMETTPHYFYEEGRGMVNTYEKHIPLKYSQWEAAIVNNEINTGVEVHFQKKVNAYDFEGKKISFAIEPGDYTKTFAKIIPKKENKESKQLFTVEEIKVIAEWAYESGVESGKQFDSGMIGESLPKSGPDFSEWWYENFDKFKLPENLSTYFYKKSIK